VLIQAIGHRFPEVRGEWQIAIGTATPLAVILFGEVAPKSIGAIMPGWFAPLVSLPLTVLEYIVWPIRIVLVGGIVVPLERLITGRRLREAPLMSTDELQAVVELSEREGAVTPDESDMLVEVLDLGERRVREAMTPRVEVVGCDLASPMDEVLALFRKSRLTKLLVYDGKMDHVVGIVYAKTAYLHPEGPLRRLVRPVYFVPEMKTVESLLKEFRSRRIQFAVVVDEFGGLAGVVTVEDCLELIVGDIEDETDRPTAEPVQRLGPSEYRLAGDLSVRSWEDLFGVDLPEGGGRYATLAGFVTSLLGRLPEQGERIRWGNVEFRIEEVRRRRVTWVRVRLLDASGAPPADEETT
jgi:putative hemolysin